MRGKAFSILIAATFVILAAQPAHAGEGDELEASYVAAGFVDHTLNRDCLDYWEEETCPVHFPGSVTVTACAGEGGLGGSGVDGMGGVRFCDVGDWRGGDVNIQIADISGLAMEVVVLCPFEGGLYLNWSRDRGLTGGWKMGESSESLFTFSYASCCADEFYIIFGAGSAVAGTVTAWV